ncbi:hypothetical protein AB205_0189640 [Aquarana catesbeiana]|uniref:Uncharacterized protein n=1 Tax=Aquarana catesbeiana TaxID=8400 RepID=A0A2G9RMP8_AQUCT|nr:hypothetical protein AB205_0189640 [Aquarana catesbeiana]
MENRLGLFLVLLSVTCFCDANNTCNVPDTKKSYVTSLAINMARSVGPCVPPDPSVLLALNLGQVKDPTAQDILIEQLKNDAVGLDLLGLCTMSSPYARSAACIVANHTTPEVCGSVDTAAVVAMGLVCVLGMENIPEKTITKVRTTLSGLLNYILEHQKDGLIGNAYSTGLAGQV